MSLLLQGIGVSRGVVVGHIRQLRGAPLDIVEYRIAADRVEEEIHRFRRAVAAAADQLRSVRKRIPADAPAEVAAFIDTHLLMLDDEALLEGVEHLISERHCNAEWAVKTQREALVSVFEEMEDPYLRTRRDDIDHVINRVLRMLVQRDGDGLATAVPSSDHAIIVAEDVSPADLILLHSQRMAALVTESGGPLSHTSILARSFGVPAIVGMRSARQLLSEGEEVVLDGRTGELIAEPTGKTVRTYRRRQRELRRHVRALKGLEKSRTITRDGEHITLRANIEIPEDLKDMRRVGADGVGLYRTEFLYLNRRDTPDEDEQFEAYRKIVRAARGQPVVIRTIDLGGEKGFLQGERREQPNPALGLRAIRLCLAEPGLFMPQLRALLRAATYGSLRIMLPMISNVAELRQARRLLQQAASELEDEGHRLGPVPPVGAMIETPAAALSSHVLARESDFLSLGTNDLVQYTLAIDRMDDSVNYLHEPAHPAVLRLIRMTLQAGRRAGVPVAMCGEMAGEVQFTPMLLGLGLEEFSMHPGTLLEVRHVIMASDAAQLRRRVRTLLRNNDPARVPQLLDRLNAVLPDAVR